MKPNELMVADCITVAHTHRQPTIEQVYGIGQTDVLVKFESGIQLFEYSRVSPVPLSEEIFKKNGFVQPFKEDSSKYCEAEEKVDCFYRIKIQDYAQEGFYIETYITDKKNVNSEKEFSGFIKYVHELQHILRLIGIEKEVKI